MVGDSEEMVCAPDLSKVKHSESRENRILIMSTETQDPQAFPHWVCHLLSGKLLESIVYFKIRTS